MCHSLRTGRLENRGCWNIPSAWECALRRILGAGNAVPAGDALHRGETGKRAEPRERVRSDCKKRSTLCSCSTGERQPALAQFRPILHCKLARSSHARGSDLLPDPFLSQGPRSQARDGTGEQHAAAYANSDLRQSTNNRRAHQEHHQRRPFGFAGLNAIFMR